MGLTRTERGWAGHYTCGSECQYTRNTLISDGKRHIVISTVGNLPKNGAGSRMQTIGCGRYYETMSFIAIKEDPYIDSDVTREILSCPTDWCISADHPRDLPDDIDNKADEMHERFVEWIMANFDSAYTQADRKKESEE